MGGAIVVMPETAAQATAIFGSLMGCCPDDSTAELLADLASATFGSYSFSYGYDPDTKLWCATGVELSDYREHWYDIGNPYADVTVLELDEISWDIARHCMVKLHGRGGSKVLSADEIASAYQELAGRPITEDDGLVLCHDCRRRVGYEKAIDAEDPDTDPDCVADEYWDEDAGCHRGYLCGACAADR